MAMRIFPSLFDSYCYGPADLVRIRKGSSTMWLSLLDSARTPCEAVYRGCVYWRLEPELAGIHLSLVQRVRASDLIRHPDCATMLALRKNAANVPMLLREWESVGLSFYLHIGDHPGMDYLVVAASMEFREIT